MAKRITMNGQSRKPLAEVFDEFVISQTAQGLSETTLLNYRHHLHSISNHLDIQKSMESLSRKDLEAMVVSMRKSGLAHNSISSYCRVLRTFLNWCKRNGINVPDLPNIKDKETVKETYTDEELIALLKRPKKDCSFCEFRNWAIVNFLMNSGCRSSTVRNIQNRDVDLGARHIILRHNKNGKIQTAPLCSLMISIL
jgi:integrase/recombinase XerD